ncbi:MAG: septum formation initiator family protein [Clostridia bacterium]|nr:septum formation initiator family protein [Clostridia bacterium]
MARVRKNRRSFIVVLVAVLLCASFAISLFTVIKEKNSIEKEINAVETELAQVNRENDSIREKLNSDNKDEYVEEIARDQLGFVKPGERVYYDVSVND